MYWFKFSHPEKIPSAIERYQKETVRVTSVLDTALAASPSGWLVGGKLTVADLAFVTWNRAALGVIEKIEGERVDVEKAYPAFYA